MVAVLVAGCAPASPSIAPPPESTSSPISTSPTPTFPSGLPLPMEMLIQRGSPTSADVFLVDVSGRIVRQLTSGPGIRPQWAPRPMVASSRTALSPQMEHSFRTPTSESSFRTWTVAAGGAYLSGRGCGATSRPGRRMPRSSPSPGRHHSREALSRSCTSSIATGVTCGSLSPSGVDDEYPAWSPNGDVIAFHRPVSGDDFFLHVVRPDGSGDREVTHGARGDEGPMWSPDGARIAFQSREGISILELASGTSSLLVPADEGGVPAACDAIGQRGHIALALWKRYSGSLRKSGTPDRRWEPIRVGACMGLGMARR